MRRDKRHDAAEIEKALPENGEAERREESDRDEFVMKYSLALAAVRNICG